ncbi:hypothetical protein niasHT_016782 [Heterodera trifolii]|uniref:Uncharacterized protein n=1 Tax=Heterodera trifolii TaxID=157864 RepID=A0ABD2LEP0_9BILA
MSLGLFPSSTAVYSSNSDNKNDQNNKFRGSTVLRASSENSATSNNSSGFALSNQQKAPFSIAEGAATAAQRPHRRGISPFKQQQQQPYISGTGGAKRKLSNTGSEQRMHQQHNQPIGTSRSASSDDDEFFLLDVEPRAKQRRYEERMSTKLSGIRLKDEHGKAVGGRTNERNFTTTASAQMAWGDQWKQQRKGPLIEEIRDWGQFGDEDELPFEDESSFQSAANAPIIEEPEEGNSTDRKGKEKSSAKNATANLCHRLEGDNQLQFDSEYCSSSADCETEEQRQQKQRIELSPELRSLISSMHNGDGGDGPLPPIGRPIRTGKELVPFVPPPSAAFFSPFPPSSAFRKDGEEDEEMLRLPPSCVEEILDDEILPDATVGTPQVQSDNEDDDWPPTPPPIENGRAKKPSKDEEREEEEDAMETD